MTLAPSQMLLLLPALLLALSACEGLAGGSHERSAADAVVRPKPAGCAIQVYAGDPPAAFLRAGQLNARLQGPGAANATLDQVLPELKQQACALGADAIGYVSERRGSDEAGGPLCVVSALAIRFDPPR